MKRLIILICVIAFLSSCEKHTWISEGVNTDFSTKLIDGYFVCSIAFDSHGTAWIGTFKQGLIKYDSGIITVFNSSNSLIPDDEVIYDVRVDSKDNVWIGTTSLIKYDGQRFTSFNSSNSKIPEDYIHSLAIDSKDNIWFTSCRHLMGGLVKFDGKNFTVFTPENSSLPSNFIQSIAIDKNDYVWLALQDKVNNAFLVKISNGNWEIFTSHDLGFSPYWFGNIKCNSKNELCASVDYSLSSLYPNPGPEAFIFNGESSKLLDINDGNGIMGLSIDKNDNIWCYDMSGSFSIYDGYNWSDRNSIFHETGIFTIEQSPDGKIWIGTGNGIYINQ